MVLCTYDTSRVKLTLHLLVCIENEKHGFCLSVGTGTTSIGTTLSS